MFCRRLKFNGNLFTRFLIGSVVFVQDWYDTIRYDTIEEINVDSKAEYTA